MGKDKIDNTRVFTHKKAVTNSTMDVLVNKVELCLPTKRLSQTAVQGQGVW